MSDVNKENVEMTGLENSDAAENVEVNTETVAEVSVEEDAETEAEVSVEVDTESEAEVSVEEGAEPETEVDVEEDAETEAEVSVEVDTEPEAEVNAEVNAEPEAEVDIEEGTELDVEAGAEVNTVANSESNPEDSIEEKTEESTEEKLDTSTELNDFSPETENTEPDVLLVLDKENIEEKKKGKAGTYIRRALAFVGITLLLLMLFLYCGMFVLIKGPSTHVRDLFVLSLKESSVGGILADMYLSEDEILAIKEANKFEETDEVTDVSIVTIPVVEDVDNDEALNENKYIVETSYDTEIYVENNIEFHKISGSTFEGIMAVVSDPSRVFIGSAKDHFDGSAGLSVPEIASKYDALLAINGAFFDDTGGVGNGGIPLGFVFSEGEEKYGGTGTVYNMMGFNKDGVLMCGRMTGQQAINYGIRDGLSCNPFLIINGEMVNVSGTGGGLNPRTALGQRADGAVLLLVIEGRMATSLGASMVDVADVMYSFGAVNAGNLDGGGSSVMYYDGEIINVVMSVYGARGIPDAVCVRP